MTATKTIRAGAALLVAALALSACAGGPAPEATDKTEKTWPADPRNLRGTAPEAPYALEVGWHFRLDAQRLADRTLYRFHNNQRQEGGQITACLATAVRADGPPLTDAKIAADLAHAVYRIEGRTVATDLSKRAPVTRIAGIEAPKTATCFATGIPWPEDERWPRVEISIP